jgi:hypothetical protein
MGAKFVGKVVIGQAVRDAYEGIAVTGRAKSRRRRNGDAYNPPHSFAVPAMPIRHPGETGNR